MLGKQVLSSAHYFLRSSTKAKEIFALNRASIFNFSKYVNHRDIAENNDSVPFEFTKENYIEITKVLQKYPKNKKKSALMPLLFIAQE